MKSKSLKLHIFALCSVYFLSGALISLPKPLENSNSLLSLLLAAVISFFFALIIIFAFKNKKLKNINRYLLIAFYIIISLGAVLDAAVMFRELLKFVHIIMMPTVSLWLCALLLIISAFWMTVNKISAVLKFSVFLFAVTSISFAVLFLMSLGQMHFYNLGSLKNIEPPPFLKETLFYILKIFLPLILLFSFVFNLEEENKKYKYASLGVLTGFVFTILTVFQITSVFSESFTAKVQFPYAAVISTVSAGNIFTRMDFAAYFIFFAVFILRAGTDLKLITLLFKKAGLKTKASMYLTAALALITAIVALF